MLIGSIYGQERVVLVPVPGLVPISSSCQLTVILSTANTIHKVPMRNFSPIIIPFSVFGQGLGPGAIF